MSDHLSPAAIRFIRAEIRRTMNVILSGQAGANTIHTEDVETMFPGSPTITGRPVMHPYGISSRAPRSTLSVIGRQGDDAGNRIVLGHRDKNRPEVAAGEVSLYNAFGQQVRLENGVVKIGSAAAAKQAVLGPELKEFLTTFIDLFIAHTHVSSAPGAPTAVPMNAAQATTAKAQNLTNDKILSTLLKLLQ